MTNLGTLGGLQTQANGINTHGQVVGHSSLSGEATSHAFLWSPRQSNGSRGSLVDLGTLGGAWSAARQISASGQVVGNSTTTDNLTRAFLWTPTSANGTVGSMVNLGTLGFLSDARSINTRGQVVGNSQAGDGSTHGFLWTPSTANGTSGSMADLGAGAANAINTQGQVAGSSNSFGHASLWTPTTSNGTTGTMTDLGTLGGSVSSANGINTQGQVVGSSWRSDQAPSLAHAFLWTPTAANGTTGSMIDLGTLGGISSVATGINTQGQVVGYSYPSDNANRHAFLWTPTTANGSTGVMVDLGILRR